MAYDVEYTCEFRDANRDTVDWREQGRQPAFLWGVYVPAADRLYDRHLDELRSEGLI